MLESVSSGMPIIATQLGSIREAVNEDVAYLKNQIFNHYMIL